MNPTRNRLGGTTTGATQHAHLMVAESGGLTTPTLENAEAVMEEVEFRATHVSLLLANMFEEARKHDSFREPEGN